MDARPHPHNPLLHHLRGLPLSARTALAGLTARPVAVTRHSTLAEQGEPATVAVAILDGFGCRVRLLPDGRRQITDLLPDGRRQITDLLLPGDLAVPGPGRSDHAVETLSACTVALVSLRELMTLAAREPGVGQALIALEAESTARLREAIVTIGRRNGPQKVAHLICQVRARLITAGRLAPGATEIPWPLRQSDVADVLALTHVHVNRSLMALRRDGLVEVRGRRAIVPDPGRLAAFCGCASPGAGDTLNGRRG